MRMFLHAFRMALRWTTDTIVWGYGDVDGIVSPVFEAERQN
jgi:hypothetical protein